MTTEELIDSENRFLRAELGTNPIWAWKHTSKLKFRVQKIVPSSTSATGFDPQYHYRSNPRTGLIELQPEYIDMPMLPMLKDNWVLARFVEANQEQAFKQKFGVRVEYPVDGIWQPVQVTALRPGIVPNRTDTWNMIYATRANKISVRELFENAEEKQDRREAVGRQNFIDECRDRFTSGMEVPGTKGAMSRFNGKPSDAVILKSQQKLTSKEIN